MNMLKLSSFLLLLALLSSCSSMSMLVRRNAKRYCGIQLTEAVSMVCSLLGGYYVPEGTNTEATTPGNSVQFVERALLPGPLFKGADAYGYLFRSGPPSYRIPAMSYERKEQRQKKGIAEECCEQQCTWLQMSAYCNGRTQDQ